MRTRNVLFGVVFFLLAGFPLSGWTQTPASVMWGEDRRSPTDFSHYEVVGEWEGNSFVVRRERKGFLLEKLDTNLVKVGEVLLPDKYGKKQMVYEWTIVFGDKLLAFFSHANKFQKRNHLIVHAIDPATLKIERHDQLVGEIPYVNRIRVAFGLRGVYGNRDIGDFNYRLSPDRQKLLLAYFHPWERDDPETIGLQVFDARRGIPSELNPIWFRDEARLPYTDELFDADGLAVDNDGNAFLSGRVWKDRAERDRKTPNYHYRILSWADSGSTSNDLKVDLKDKFITGLEFAVKDNELVCGGLYSNEDTTGVKGVFYLRINPLTRKLRSRSIKDFSFDLITEHLTDGQKKRYARREEKGRAVELYQYDLDEIVLREDGGALLIAEQFYVENLTPDRSPGQPLDTPADERIYHNNHLLITSIDREGNIEWTQKVPKRQYARNDYLNLSYGLSVAQDRIFLLFYDNKLNFDPQSKKVHRHSTDVLALVEIDRTGKVKKQPLLTRKDITYPLQPREFHQTTRNELIIYGEKERWFQYGKVVFSP